MRLVKPAIVATALALAVTASTAWPKPPQPTERLVGKVRVELKDLDLNRPGDVRILLDRLTQAAWRACGGDPRLNDSYRARPEETVRVYEECRDNAVKRAIDQIGAPLLAQFHDEQQRPVAAEGVSISEPISGEWSPAAGCDRRIPGTATGRPAPR